MERACAVIFLCNKVDSTSSFPAALSSPGCECHLCALPSDSPAASPETLSWTSSPPFAPETPPGLQASPLEERRGEFKSFPEASLC